MKNRLLAVAILLLGILPAAFAQTGTWSGALEVQGTKLTLVFHLDEENPTVDCPDQGIRGFHIEVDRGDFGKITLLIPSISATYEGQLMMNKIFGTYSQMGVSLPLTLTPGEPKLNRPQTPQPPFPYAQEEVSFANGNAVLQGTLVLPEGWSRKTPVLIMVTGSGLQNRDEELFEHKPFAVIADALARAGIATLRYDDRGFGASTGDIINCTTEDLKNDALAGIRLLRERFDNVGVIGHSEGGTIALMLAEEKQADFIVSLAGMVVSGAEMLLWQNRNELPRLGIDAETTDTYCKALEATFTALVEGRPFPNAADYKLPEALRQNLQTVQAQLEMPYLRYFVKLDVSQRLGQIACPVLALNGTRDQQVEYERNLGALRAGLPTRPGNKIVPVEGVNHMFQHCTTGLVQEYREIEETFAPEALEIIIQWLSALQ